MRYRLILSTAMAVAAWGLTANLLAATAPLKVAGIFGDNMVFQRDRPVPVWGTAEPGAAVTVRFSGQTKQATATADGTWKVMLEPCPAALAPGELTVAVDNPAAITTDQPGGGKAEFHNVVVGEVWLCSGQSNMGYPLAPRSGSKERLGTENPALRLFTVPAKLAETPQADLEGRWDVCGPETVGTFSAVAYYAGRDIQKALGVPVGLILSQYGGSSVRLWIGQAVAAADAQVQPVLGAGKGTGRLYNGMIAPLVPYGIRGVLWYQGEADTGSPAQYGILFPGLIRGWRTAWGQGEFPFLFVQLAPYLKIVSEPQESNWARLREVQSRVAETVPSTGMVVITDFGHEIDIHVKPKQPVGARLALLARATVYGEKVEYSGPRFAGMKVEGERARAIVSFTHADGGLEAREMVLEDVKTDPRLGQGGALHVKLGGGRIWTPVNGFTIAGDDRKFYNAHAEIRGSEVVVSSPEVKTPVAVRYGWADYPTGNLFNRDGFPAAPFRTDDWPGTAAPEPNRAR